MRSYGQYCSLARALDVVGDRWSLLIVRELLLRGPCRYSDLRAGLPGIATNLLAQRLRELEQAGIVRREEAPPPVARTLFALTPRGEELERTLRELGRWGIPLMVEGPGEGDEFRSPWLRLPVELFLRDRAPAQGPLTVELRAGGEPVTVLAAGGELRSRPGPSEDPDVVVSGPPQPMLALLAGRIAPSEARRAGLRLDGDVNGLARLLPDPPTTAAGAALAGEGEG
jgi:DNA-binding HxlR family transcriptional regulator